MGVIEITSSSVTLQWGAVDCIHLNGDITGYSVLYGVKGSGSTQTVTVSFDVTQATISGLIPNAVYEIQVAAVNIVSEGTYSDAIEGKVTQCEVG